MGERVGLVFGDGKIPCDLGTEVVRVRANSVAAVVGPRHDHGEEFALPA